MDKQIFIKIIFFTLISLVAGYGISTYSFYKTIDSGNGFNPGLFGSGVFCLIAGIACVIIGCNRPDRVEQRSWDDFLMEMLITS